VVAFSTEFASRAAMGMMANCRRRSSGNRQNFLSRPSLRFHLRRKGSQFSCRGSPSKRWRSPVGSQPVRQAPLPGGGACAQPVLPGAKSGAGTAGPLADATCGKRFKSFKASQPLCLISKDERVVGVRLAQNRRPVRAAPPL